MFHYKTSTAVVLFVSIFAFFALSGVTIRSSSAQSGDVSAPKFVAPRFTETERTDSEGSETKSTDFDLDDSSSPVLEVKEEGDASTKETTDNVNSSLELTDGKVDREPYDVYKENGQYFVDWEKPELALVFTGMTNGYIEPCGCAGMERMKGGLSRRDTFLRELRNERDWEIATIDTGQITTGFGVQEELKFDMAMNAFNLMDYDAIGIGKGELRFPAYFLLTFTAPTSSTSQSLFVSGNIGVYGFHSTYTLPYKVIERGGTRIGVTSVVCGDETTERRDENIHYESPEKRLQDLLPALKKENCDHWILIVHGDGDQTQQLANQFPFFDYIVTSDTPSEPPAELKRLSDKQSLVEVGEKGKYAIVIGLFKNGATRYQRVALDSRYESSSEITLLMKDYQSILKSLITTKGFRGGLGITPVRSPQSDLLGKYVGSQKCRSCHEDSYRIWSRSRHATAWKSLKETANPSRDFDPECISCHVVGWDGAKRFPYVDGYSSEKKTPELLNVGCECCHGPGERHMAAEIGSDEALQERLRSAMRLGENVKKVCYQCHDGDNSPSFDFDAYYPLIEHKDSDTDDEE